MWKIVLENLIPLIVAVLTPVLLVLARGLLQAAAKKWHLDWALKYEDKVDDLVVKGIKAVEKKALSAAKANQPKTTSEKKLEEVVVWVNSQLKVNNLPEKAGNELAMIVESKLFDGVEKQTNGVNK